jgi:hypothetical protein
MRGKGEEEIRERKRDVKKEEKVRGRGGKMGGIYTLRRAFSIWTTH